MPQPFIDWKLVESRRFDRYRYELIYALRPDQSRIYRGFVVFANGKDYWLEHESIDALRAQLMELGRQGG